MRKRRTYRLAATKPLVPSVDLSPDGHDFATVATSPPFSYLGKLWHDTRSYQADLTKIFLGGSASYPWGSSYPLRTIGGPGLFLVASDFTAGSLTGGLAEAIAELAGFDGTVYLPRASYPIDDDYTIPSTVHIIFAHGASCAIANTKTLTINGTIEAGLYQIFSLTGTGKVIMGKVQPLFPQWWGAVLDGVTDDIIPIQAMIDATGDTTSIRPGKCEFTGPAAISDTILLERKSIEMYGVGWGSSSASYPSGQYLKWIGSAGSPMLRPHRSYGCYIHDLRFIGDSTAKPSAAISLYQLSADGNINTWNKFERIWIGSFGGFDDDDAVQFDVGILGEGDNNNNSYNFFDNIKINKCTTGVDIQNAQYGGWQLDNLLVSDCVTGFKTASHAYGSNWYFSNNSTADIELVHQGGQTAARLVLTSYSSENAGRLAVMATDTKLSIRGGFFTASDGKLNADGKMIDGVNNGFNMVTISDFLFTDAFTGTPTISLKEASGGGIEKSLILTNVGGIGISNIDMNPGATAGNYRYIHVQDSGKIIHAELRSGDTLSAGYTTIEKFALGSPTELTISGGIITVTQSNHTVDTENDDADDDLDTINGGIDGMLLILRSVDSARDVTLKDGADNLILAGDFTLSHQYDRIELIYDATQSAWTERSRSDNS